MECPMCKLENPDSAVRCDCGYDFKKRTVEQSYLTANEKSYGVSRKPSDALIIIGWITSILGGWLGILIACSIVYGKDYNNRLEYKYDEESRKIGKNMLIVSICITALGIIARMFLIDK